MGVLIFELRCGFIQHKLFYFKTTIKRLCTRCFYVSVTCPVLRDPDSNPYSLLEGEGELADADVGEGMGEDRRRRSRRRRSDQEPSVMDAAVESDGQAGPNENGIGERVQQL